MIITLDQRAQFLAWALAENYWASHLLTRGLARTASEAEPLLKGVGQVMSAATYAGGFGTREDVLETGRMLPFFAGRNDNDEMLKIINLLLHDCYSGDCWIESVQPDELGRRLYERTFEGDEQTRRAVFKAVAKTSGVRPPDGRR